MKSISKFFIFWTRKADKLMALGFFLIFDTGLLAQISFNADQGRTFYAYNSPFSKYNLHSAGSANGKGYIKIIQSNLFSSSFSVQIDIRKNNIYAGIERNSISFNKQPFQRDGQLIRTFNFSVLSLGLGRTWIISKPESTKIKLSGNIYGFSILNKTGVEKNSTLYFNPPSHLGYEDVKRESISLGGRDIGIGLQGRVNFYPKLIWPNLAIYTKLDFSISKYFGLDWGWQEDGNPQPGIDVLDCFRKTISIGIMSTLVKQK